MQSHLPLTLNMTTGVTSPLSFGVLFPSLWPVGLSLGHLVPKSYTQLTKTPLSALLWSHRYYLLTH